MLVASLVSVTVTPGITPLASRTMPRTPPVNCWASAGTSAARRIAAETRTRTKPLSMFALRCLRVQRVGDVFVKPRLFYARTLTRSRISRLLTCTCVCLASAVGGAQSDQSAQALAQRGIEALHWFEYEEANDLFRSAQARDPSSVLAVWGEAMTYDQTLWRHEDSSAARRILSRLGATEAQRAAKGRTHKERMLIAAAEARF